MKMEHSIKLQPEWNLLILAWIDRTLGIDLSMIYFISFVLCFLGYRWIYHHGFLRVSYGEK